MYMYSGFVSHKPARITRKGQESTLNIMAVMIVMSVVFLYVFYITEGGKVESSKIFADQKKYKYAEIVLSDMYYVTPDGHSNTLTEIIGISEEFGNPSRGYEYQSMYSFVQPKIILKQYFDITLQDYHYYFFIENGGKKTQEINSLEDADSQIMSHMISIPLPVSGHSVFAYLYIW